ncbi:hypothetical protein [Nocardiopsis sp. LOL_012]|uniref:hypothetical protein n=1 Tax=Nocardiopsis sp. LOL_012 TaxID=3345409 RepID=UPI003A8A9F03
MDTPAEVESGSDGGSDGSPGPVSQMSLWAPPRSTRYKSKRRKRILLLAGSVAAVAVLAGGAAAVAVFVGGDSGSAGEAVSTGEFVGSWSGEMNQVDTEGQHVADWDARVSIEEGAEHGTSAWITFSCSGSLVLSASEGDRAVYAYTETADPEDRCVDDAELTLWPEEDGRGLRAEWSSVTDEGTRMTSTGVLG